MEGGDEVIETQARVTRAFALRQAQGPMVASVAELAEAPGRGPCLSHQPFPPPIELRWHSAFTSFPMFN